MERLSDLIAILAQICFNENKFPQQKQTTDI